RTRFVADFVGEGVLLPGRVVSDSRVEIELGLLEGVTAAACDGGSCMVYGQGAAVNVLLRPDDILHDDTSSLTAIIERRAFRGADFLYTLRLKSGRTVLALVPSHHDHAIGEAIGIRLTVDHVVAFSAP
ncbi:MAG: TOBE domain-containing protein, partial [Betaproteobacteria bacterium]|nr:TOBE domain-containing protein [Betaproteobacteria bacterium]